MKIFPTKFLESITQKHWIKVTTTQPSCIYYFGPFLTNKEAKFAQPGFIEDLESENAEGIKAEIKRCQPQELTFCEDSVDSCNLTSLFMDSRDLAIGDYYQRYNTVKPPLSIYSS